MDFRLLKNKQAGKYVISAPRRAKRTNADQKALICPFCPGSEKQEEEVYRVSEVSKDGKISKVLDSDWLVRVIKNKFPFADHHEVIIHSPDHHKNFDELPLSQGMQIIKTYKERFETLKDKGRVYIFNNHGHQGGESVPHPHTQLVVIPEEIAGLVPEMDRSVYSKKQNVILSGAKDLLNFRDSSPDVHRDQNDGEKLETEHFLVFCPATSEWPDEVWVAPKINGKGFGSVTDKAVAEFALVLSRLIQIFDTRHGHEFPFNFYISPHDNWYLRFIPREKILGGFELGTGVSVNTQDPKETMEFIKAHFWEPDFEKIKKEHRAEYVNKV